jgi:DNA-directed RNA polymerase subunit RPC12/RpoP
VAVELLAHGTWLDDLAVPIVVAAVFSAGVLRASAGTRGADGACPYCGAPRTAEVLSARVDGAPGGAAPTTVRCGRCGFRLAARLSASEAAPVAPGEEPR